LLSHVAKYIITTNFANSAGCIGGRLPILNHLFAPFTSSPNKRTSRRREAIIIKSGKENLRIFL